MTTAATGLWACSPQPKETISSPAPTFNASELWEQIRADIELFYAYLDRDDFDSEAYLDRLGERLIQSENVEAFRVELHRATFAFTDPHFIVGPFDKTDFNIIPTSSDLIVGGDNFNIIDVRAGSAADAADIRPGWRLLEVNDKPLSPSIEQVFEGLLSDITPQQRDYVATLIANGRIGQERRLRLQNPAGDVIVLTLPSPAGFARTVSNLPPIEIDYPAEGIARMRINNRLGDNAMVAEFDEAFEKLGPVNGFILDMRNTPSGGNTTVAQALMGQFVSEPTAYQIHDYPSMEREFGVPRRSVEHVLPRAPFIDVPLVVLGGPWTGSMGEGIVIGLDAAADAHVIASDMGDLLGGLINLSYADNQIKIDLGREKLSHMDGTPREDFLADQPLMSADRDEDGNDPALRAALTWFAEHASQ
ncbi:MAG: hypothetical protein AAFP97_06275 [Pseudomonadota bacterium]